MVPSPWPPPPSFDVWDQGPRVLIGLDFPPFTERIVAPLFADYDPPADSTCVHYGSITVYRIFSPTVATDVVAAGSESPMNTYMDS